MGQKKKQADLFVHFSRRSAISDQRQEESRGMQLRGEGKRFSKGLPSQGKLINAGEAGGGQEGNEEDEQRRGI